MNKRNRPDKDGKDKTKVKKWKERILQQRPIICHICGLEINPNLPPNHKLVFNVDHIIPIDLGGTSNHDNLAPSHFLCNRAKGTKIGLTKKQVEELRKKVLELQSEDSKEEDDEEGFNFNDSDIENKKKLNRIKRYIPTSEIEELIDVIYTDENTTIDDNGHSILKESVKRQYQDELEAIERYYDLLSIELNTL